MRRSLLLLLCPVFALAADGAVVVPPTCFTVPATPTHIADGDTFDADVRVWHGAGLGQRFVVVQDRIRVAGVDTPERGQPGFQAATAFAAAWLLKGDVVLRSCERDRGNRAVATVTRDGEDLATLLKAAGLGR